MNIIELEINNLCECKHALLHFPFNIQKCPLYLVHSNTNCGIITLALQLICGMRYTSYEALNEIHDKIANARVKITFSLIQSTTSQRQNEISQNKEHSSDSDVPSTSEQARHRLKVRLERRQREMKRNIVIVNACRDFTLNPDLIIYTVDGGLQMECSPLLFQIRFFTCTDIIFPRLKNITHGDYCNGKWLDLLTTDFIEKGFFTDHLLKQFCELYADRKISKNHVLCKLTSTVLTAKNLLNNSRISHLINILNDIRWLFEYMTCSEFTVWFMLPTVFGKLQDITKINTENINFDLMKTQVQVNHTNERPFPWTHAEKHVQELLLVAVQLAFGYHCEQNIIYLHSLNYLKEHQNFEYLGYYLVQSSTTRQLFFEKNYMNRIFVICARLKICCVLEYSGALISYPSQGFVIKCNWLDSPREWQLSVKDYPPESNTDSNLTQSFAQYIDKLLK